MYIEMTPKYSPILQWPPPKNIHKIFIPPKIFIFLKKKTNKNIEIKMLTQKMVQAYF